MNAKPVPLHCQLPTKYFSSFSFGFGPGGASAARTVEAAKARAMIGKRTRFMQALLSVVREMVVEPRAPAAGHVTMTPAMQVDVSELEAHRASLTGHCYRMLGSATDAEDAVQETFVRAWRGLDRFEGRASVRTWLHRIATNVCLDALSDTSRRMRPIE